jgi:hypothetical protein
MLFAAAVGDKLANLSPAELCPARAPDTTGNMVHKTISAEPNALEDEIITMPLPPSGRTW